MSCYAPEPLSKFDTVSNITNPNSLLLPYIYPLTRWQNQQKTGILIYYVTISRMQANRPIGVAAKVVKKNKDIELIDANENRYAHQPQSISVMTVTDTTVQLN